MKNNKDLYLGEDDQKKLESMSEIERENILNERYRELMEIENRKIMSKSKNERQIIEFENINFIITKNMLVENLYKPTLNKIKGCFVKAKIGNEYCVCKVLKIIEGELYDIEWRSKKVLKTNLYLGIDSGNRVYNDLKIINVSNRELSEEEFMEFIKMFEIKDINTIIKKYDIFEKEMNRSLNDNEILEMMTIKNKMNPRKISNTERLMDLICSRNKAIEIKDKVNALKYQEMIIEIEEEEKGKGNNLEWNKNKL